MSFAELNAGRVIRCIHPLSALERWTVVLGGYLDGSGKITSHDHVVVVAGFLADVTAWVRFESEWEALLRDFKIAGRFHATNYCARARPYDRWDEEKRASFERRVEEIFRLTSPIGVGCGVSTRVFEEWRGVQLRFYDPDPYVFCVDWCLREMIRKFSQPPPAKDGIAIFIDQEPEHEAVGRAVAKWHEAKLRKVPSRKVGHPDPLRDVSVTYGSNIKFVPLQAADMLSHALFQRMRDTETTFGPPPQPIFMRVLRAAHIPLAVMEFHDGVTLDILMTAGERDGQ